MGGLYKNITIYFYNISMQVNHASAAYVVLTMLLTMKSFKKLITDQYNISNRITIQQICAAASKANNNKTAKLQRYTGTHTRIYTDIPILYVQNAAGNRNG